MLALEPGTSVSATSVGGDFLLPRDTSRPLLLIAGGIGITPFVSQLAHSNDRAENRDIVLVYACSSPTEIAYLPQLARSGHTRSS